MGLGETMKDRIDMALTIRELGIRSIPVNMLNPITGTPYENNEKLTNVDMCRIVAVFRFLVPNASIRLAGGRGLLEDKEVKCFQSGANAAISGDMLTTSGIFITATGTDVGKTFVTALMVKKLRDKGYNTGYYKAARSGQK